MNADAERGGMVLRTIAVACRALVSVALIVPSTTRAQVELINLLDNGPTSTHINVVIVAEGYTVDQRLKFENDARKMLETLFLTQPYDVYKSYFNAFGLFVASNDSGSTHPSIGIHRDTYFNSYYDCNGIRSLICISTFGNARLGDILRDWIPEYDITMMLVNDLTYGGSGGGVAISSVNRFGLDIMMHEIGHSFAKLADEYEGSHAGVGGANVTTRTHYDHIPWRHWINPWTPIPTPYNEDYIYVVGLFRGANRAPDGWYRPEHSCKMRTLRAPFCTVCREHHVLAIYRLISPLEESWPASYTVVVQEDGDVELGVKTRVPGDLLEITWGVGWGSVPVAGGTTLTLSANDIPEGGLTVTAIVRDTNPSVRALLTLLSESVTWRVVRAAVSADETGTPRQAHLAQNHPNPFYGTTTFSFTLPEPTSVRLVVYDVLGREVATLHNGPLEAGEHEIAYSTGLPAGLYAYRLYGPEYVLTRKFTIVQ